MKHKPSFLTHLYKLAVGLALFAVPCSLPANDLENPYVTGAPWDLRQWLSADYDGDDGYVITDGEGNVEKWEDRSATTAYDMEQQSDSSRRPNFMSGIEHPSGVGTIFFDGDEFDYLYGDGLLNDTWDDITIVAVWRVAEQQEAILWEHGNLSLQLADNGTYGIAVNGSFTDEVHDYGEYEHIVSVAWITPGTQTKAELYHNTLPANETYSEIGTLSISSSDIPTLGGTEPWDVTKDFEGEILEFLVYREALNEDMLEHITDTFEDNYNLSLDRSGDGLPDDPDADANWDGYEHHWLSNLGLNPWDTDPDLTEVAPNEGDLTLMLPERGLYFVNDPDGEMVLIEGQAE